MILAGKKQNQINQNCARVEEALSFLSITGAKALLLSGQLPMCQNFRGRKDSEGKSERFPPFDTYKQQGSTGSLDLGKAKAEIDYNDSNNRGS